MLHLLTVTGGHEGNGGRRAAVSGALEGQGDLGGLNDHCTDTGEH